MNEEELKKKVSQLRREVTSREKRIKGIYAKIKTHQLEASKTKIARDKYNTRVKDCLLQTKGLRQERDKLNEEVSQLKKKHKQIIGQTKDQAKHMKMLKKERDSLNKQAKTTDKILEKRLENILKKLENADIPLDKEIRSYDDAVKTLKYLNIARKATELHNKMGQEYEKLKSVRDELNRISADIESKKKQADEYHTNVREKYKEIDETRKTADQHHKKLKEEYDRIAPLREDISAVKAEMGEIQKMMKPYAEELEKIRSAREEKKRTANAEKIKEKLQNSKRVSLDDFRQMLKYGSRDTTDNRSD